MGGAREHHFAAEYNASSDLIQRWKSGSIYRPHTELRKVERFVFFLHNAVLQVVWNLSFADYQKPKKIYSINSQKAHHFADYNASSDLIQSWKSCSIVLALFSSQICFSDFMEQKLFTILGTQNKIILSQKEHHFS